MYAGQAWWNMPVVSAFRKLRWEDLKFQTSTPPNPHHLQVVEVWQKPVIPAFVRLKQEDLESEASLGYIKQDAVPPKNKQNKQTNKKQS
jgi:hypothetical protein